MVGHQAFVAPLRAVLSRWRAENRGLRRFSHFRAA
jgi:hypothetical protein